MAHIILLGTSHIAEQSLKQLKKAVKEHDPDIIAVELDRRRLHALMTDQKPDYSLSQIRHIGLKGYLFALIGSRLQQRLGKTVGIVPGADMKAAAKMAQEQGRTILLMDRDITLTLRRLSDKLTRKERWRFASDLLFGRFKRQPRIAIDLKAVPDNEMIVKLLAELKGRYPTLHEVLVDERNHFMARQLLAAAREHPEKTILAVAGAGHVAGLQAILERAAKHS